MALAHSVAIQIKSTGCNRIVDTVQSNLVSSHLFNASVSAAAPFASKSGSLVNPFGAGLVCPTEHKMALKRGAPLASSPPHVISTASGSSSEMAISSLWGKSKRQTTRYHMKNNKKKKKMREEENEKKEKKEKKRRKNI